jgi:hypothetical protein
MTPFEKQEQIKASILASYSNVPVIKKSEEATELEKGAEEKKEEESTEETK